MTENKTNPAEAKKEVVVPAIFKQYGIEADKAKTSMAKALDFLNGLKGKPLTAEVIKQFADNFATKSTRTGSGQPREATKLFDKDGNLIGGRCRATGKWFAAEFFNFHHSMAKEADKLNNRLVAQAKKIEQDAKELLDNAREEKDAKTKLKIFEQYDAELNKAKKVRGGEIKLADFENKVQNFETVEELAKQLKVEVITAAKKD